VAHLALRTSEALIIALGVILLMLRLALPLANNQGAALQRWLGAQLGRQVRIGSIRGYWQGWTPELVLEAVRLMPATGVANETSSVRLAKVRLALDPLASLRALAPRVAAVTLTGVAVALVRDPSGVLSVRGLSGTGRTGIGAALPAALLGQARLRLENTAVIWIDRRAHRPPLVLTDGTLELASNGPRHRLTATLRLPRKYGGKVEMRARIEGNPVGPEWSGDIYLQARGVRVAAAGILGLPGSVRFGASTIDLKIWSNWRAGRLAHAAGEYALPELELLPATGTVVTLGSRAGGFAWSRTGAGWTLIVGLDKRGAGAMLSLAGASNQTQRRLRGRLTGVALADVVTALRSLPQASSEWTSIVAGFHPRGRLTQLEFGLRPDARWRDGLRAVAQVRAVSATGDGLRLAGLDARIESDGTSVVAQIDSGEVASTFGGLLSRSHTLEQLSGRVVGGWRAGDRYLDSATSS